MGERRWRIWVCPVCNAVWDDDSHVEWCEGGYTFPDRDVPEHDRATLQAVQVCPATDLDRYRELVRELMDAGGSLAGLLHKSIYSTDPDMGRWRRIVAEARQLLGDNEEEGWPNRTGAENVTVRGYSLALTEREMAELHWALYRTYGNDLGWWGKLEAACGGRWPNVVSASGPRQLSEHAGADAAHHAPARAEQENTDPEDRP